MRKAVEKIVELPPRRVEQTDIPIIGETPYISHAWSHKARTQMLDKQMGKARAKKPPKDPWIDFCESLYWMSDKPENPTQEDIDSAQFGIPAIAFKAAAVSACRLVSGIPMTLARISFHILGPLVEIKGKPEMHEAFVRNETGVADIRYRAIFNEWSAILRVYYDPTTISLDNVVTLIDRGGFGPGVGDNRPERGGENGRYRVQETGWGHKREL